MPALQQKLVRDLIHLRGQLAAVTLVVACGIGTYVTMRSSYQSLVSAQAGYYASYRFADVFAHLKRAPEWLAREMAAVPGVASVQTRVVMEVTLDIAGVAEPATARLVSIPDRHTPMLNDLFIRRGRYVEAGHSDDVLMSEAFAAANRLDVGDTVDAVMNGRWKRLRIAGIALSPEYVYEIRGGEVFPDNKRFGVLWMSREALGPAFNMEGAFNDVALSLARGASEAEVIARLDTLLEPYGGLGAYGRGDQISHRFLTDEIAENRTSGLILPTLFLGIVAFLLHILLSRVVATERSQIAVLKAFGYSSVAIGVHYLQLALVAVSGGTVLGTALGLWLGASLKDRYAMFFHFPYLQFQPDLGLILLAVAISAGAASLGALQALRAAVALAPADAMRPEPPASFRPSLLERTSLWKLASPALRMIIRNIDRRRWKAFFTVLAMACAAAIIVVGRYATDAIDYMVNLQFHILQREDVTVIFQEPRTARAQHSLTSLPGVVYSEAFREVPARLRFRHRSRRVGLVGLSAPGDLRRLMDRELRVIELPPEGMVMTKKLGEILGVTVGDIVTVEVLEGARPVRRVAVTGLVDEPIGLGAYMDRRALNRLMREAETVSGAYLSVDPLRAPQLYVFLKRTPSISGVAVRQAMLTSFWQTFGNMMNTSTYTLIAFACVIALGIVYNGARIALSERGQELASLRVLGFERREIAAILLGEQAALTLAAMPCGLALGYGLCVLVSKAMNREMFRMPLVVSGDTYIFASLVVALAALFSGLLVVRRLNRMDLTAVLKSRE